MTQDSASDPAPMQGSSVDLAALAPADRLGALNAAFEYRGDVTLALVDGSALECYVFDRRAASATDPGSVRVLVTATGERRTIPFDRIARLEFTGKDTAAGKTWENWVRRYVEKRLAGEHASIESESLG
jgi:hypothetical protein